MYTFGLIISVLTCGSLLFANKIGSGHSMALGYTIMAKAHPPLVHNFKLLCINPGNQVFVFDVDVYKASRVRLCKFGLSAEGDGNKFLPRVAIEHRRAF